MNTQPKKLIKKVLVIGSGPIIIGQAAEFDYAGTQACKSLREEGITTVLVNSNPATIMTDEDIADKIYIEPLTVEVLSRIIDAERPDGILPTLGGQTGLNLAVELAESGMLDKFSVKLLGTPLQSIKSAEDRDLFRKLLLDISEPVLPGATVSSIDAAKEALTALGLPLVVRPAYTLGGTGGGIANTFDEFITIVSSGLAASPIKQVLIETSLVGWKEIEYEVMRDGADNCITVCNMENMDPMGIHTGDSIVVAPSQTLSDKEYQMLRSSSLKIIRALGIEGGCNVQYALAPGEVVSPTLVNNESHASGYYVIEVNPRVSRSSALASKATGYPIARVAAKIAAGKRLDQIQNAVTEKTLAAFEPSLDYCVVKIPRWPFDKFPAANRDIGTQMKATGEVMAIDRSFTAAFLKAVRSLEISGHDHLWEDSNWEIESSMDGSSLFNNVALHPNDERLWAILFTLRKGISPENISQFTGIDPWFTRALASIVSMENRLVFENLTKDLLRRAKRLGFSDSAIASLTDRPYESVRKLRERWGIRPVYKMVDTCAAEFEAQTPYFYSTYEQENEALPLEGKCVLVLGSGPIRIGQGIEFDYCSVHAAWALQRHGFKSIIVNSNPETVSTDFDTSDRLYFEPLDDESVRDIIENERGVDNKNTTPSVVQFGGQTAINLSQSLDTVGLPILGSSAKSIDIASDRHLFEKFLSETGIPNPPGAAVTSVDRALKVANDVGYPVLVRPSYVLGGRGMEIVQNEPELVRFVTSAMEIGEGRPVLVDKYFEGREVEVDAVCDGEDVLIPGIMEHVERAGVHSGDSMAIYPGLTLTAKEVDTIVDYTTRVGLALKIKGLMNIQYVLLGGATYRKPGLQDHLSDDTEVYIIEVNPRASRTIPFISKMTGVPMVQLAVSAIVGKTLKKQGYEGGLWPKQPVVGVKAPVFSMSKLIGADTYLGPEMKSTGEVMGIDSNFQSAVTKALEAAGLLVQRGGAVLLSIADRNKKDAEPLIRALFASECKFYATQGTAAMIEALGIPVAAVPKRLNEGHPNVVDLIQDGSVKAVVNTVTGDREALQDGFEIRRTAVEYGVPCFTSIDTARIAADALLDSDKSYSIKPFPEHRKG